MTPEAKIKKGICTYLRSLGAYVFCPVQRGLGSSALDILVCHQGRFYGIEVKVPGKKPTPRQAIVMEQINVAGGRAVLACSADEVYELVSR